VRSWRAAVEGGGDWSVGAADGMRVLCDGRAEGRLLGGCLSILAEGLGTPWALRVEEPCVLFLEDIGTKPYKWDRLLQHLKFAGLMKRVTGVVLGDMSANVEESEIELLEQACLHALRDFEGPVAIGLKSGHVEAGNRSLPLGVWVKMDGGGLRV
jgi:muramoyltetrapeptide carboxypeptidase